MTYEKVWKEHKKWVDETVKELRKDWEDAPEEHKLLFKTKLDTLSIVQHRLDQDEKLYPLDVKQREIEKRQQMEE